MKKKIQGWLIPLVCSVSITLTGTLIYTCLSIGYFQGQTQTQLAALKAQQDNLRKILLNVLMTKRDNQ